MTALDRPRVLEISSNRSNSQPSKPSKANFDGFVGATPTSSKNFASERLARAAEMVDRKRHCLGTGATNASPNVRRRRSAFARSHQRQIGDRRGGPNSARFQRATIVTSYPEPLVEEQRALHGAPVDAVPPATQAVAGYRGRQPQRSPSLVPNRRRSGTK
jgi:hypothetical protein